MSKELVIRWESAANGDAPDQGADFQEVATTPWLRRVFTPWSIACSPGHPNFMGLKKLGAQQWHGKRLGLYRQHDTGYLTVMGNSFCFPLDCDYDVGHHFYPGIGDNSDRVRIEVRPTQVHVAVIHDTGMSCDQVALVWNRTTDTVNFHNVDLAWTAGLFGVKLLSRDAEAAERAKPLDELPTDSKFGFYRSSDGQRAVLSVLGLFATFSLKRNYISVQHLYHKDWRVRVRLEVFRGQVRAVAIDDGASRAECRLATWDLGSGAVTFDTVSLKWAAKRFAVNVIERPMGGDLCYKQPTQDPILPFPPVGA